MKAITVLTTGIKTQNYLLRVFLKKPPKNRTFTPTIFKKSETILFFFCISWGESTEGEKRKWVLYAF